ncbi:MAG: hypothetical protein DWQ31_01930 [Planctomycetota bacterium]|nr:MAG: hypothetical protein DWQ31_01930 [Planctomycetota bacterium]REJ95426.1 MAG: hypothetical protein DWQ35_06790 [Planctomycetota bacterium]REK23564.1 MAG: hypothetical protein DWQ42_15105 [Planctomycetota bacterium]REK46075.1 MAG: hypothetical protein DWQ46_07435 [Planctomycetota bacterium]
MKAASEASSPVDSGAARRYQSKFALCGANRATAVRVEWLGFAAGGYICNLAGAVSKEAVAASNEHAPFV